MPKGEIIGKKNKELEIHNGFEHMEEYEKLILDKKKMLLKK
ncbi:hypothetical protein Q5M85_01645 [Paraclostridium bifermentans]|nr:hypothetical protein [Paraclostridium bifermentans]